MDFSDLESKGKVQFFGKAMDGSAVVVWQGMRHVAPKPDTFDRELKFLINTLERGRKEGRVTDKISMIFDRSGMRTDKADVKLLSYIVPVFQAHYPEMLSRMYVFPTTSMFWVFWGMAGLVFDPVTLSKVVLLYNRSTSRTQQPL
jgi:CRAL/TRIO domain